MPDLRALLSAATPGPWTLDGRVAWCLTPPEAAGYDGEHDLVLEAFTDRNAALIVAAVNALPALLDAPEDTRDHSDDPASRRIAAETLR